MWPGIVPRSLQRTMKDLHPGEQIIYEGHPSWRSILGYSITTQRLRIKHGIIARHVQQTDITRVQNVNTAQSVLERILQVGTVDFDTAGSGDYDFAFRGVAQPEEVARDVDR